MILTPFRNFEPLKPPGKALAWTFPIPILFNPFIIWDYYKLAVPILAILVILGDWLTKWQMVPLSLVVGLILLGLFTAILLLLSLIYRRGFHATFTLSEGRGVLLRPAYGGLISLMVGALFGLAQDFNQGSSSIEWDLVRKVAIHEKRRVISLRSPLTTMARLYCTEDNFGEVLALITARIPSIPQQHLG